MSGPESGNGSNGAPDIERFRTGIGSYSTETLHAADAAELSRMLEERIRLLEDPPLPIEALFNPSVRPRLAGGGKAKTWHREQLLRFALLLLDGKSSSEIATALNEERESDSLLDASAINVFVFKFFSPEAQALARKTSEERRMQDFLFPADPEIRKKLKILLIRAKNVGLAPDRILISGWNEPEEKRAERKQRRRSALDPSLNDPDKAIEILYARFCENRSREEQLALASNLLGRKVSRTSLGVFFTKGLTKEAKDAFGIRDIEAEMFDDEDFKTVADMLIADNLIRMKDIARTLERQKNDVSYKVRYKGEQLKKLEKYKNDEPLVAFLMEYGSFPEGVDPRAAAREIAAIHADTNLKQRILKRREWGNTLKEGK